MDLMRIRRAGCSLALLLAGCAPQPLAEAVDPRALPVRGHITVLVFFSPGCHCLDAHDARLVGMYERFHDRGVEFAMVDSESGGSPERDAREARRRGYPFPIVRDPGARLADALGAQFASYSVVLDADGRVRYRGGIDSDESRLHAGARLYLQDAVEDLLAGRAPRIAEGEALGCALQRW
jgi:hypothetical protein